MADQNQKKKNTPETGVKKPVEPSSDKTSLLILKDNITTSTTSNKWDPYLYTKKTPGMIGRSKFIDRGVLFSDTPRFTPAQLGNFERPRLNEETLREAVIIITDAPDIEFTPSIQTAVKSGQEAELYIKSRIISAISDRIVRMTSDQKSASIDDATIIEALKSDSQLKERLINNGAFRSLVGLPAIEDRARPADAFAQAAASEPSPTLTPSERWAERTTGRKENPAAFIRRVYAKELAGGSLTRAMLLQSDPKLYQAYAVSIARNSMFDLHLPTQPRTKLATVGSATEHVRAQWRTAKARQRLQNS